MSLQKFRSNTHDPWRLSVYDLGAFLESKRVRRNDPCVTVDALVEAWKDYIGSDNSPRLRGMPRTFVRTCTKAGVTEAQIIDMLFDILDKQGGWL